MDTRITPYAGTSCDRLTEIINNCNPGPDIMEGVDFEYTEFEPIDDNPDYNASILLKSLRKDRSSARAYFNRLDLSVLDELPVEMLHSVTMPEFPTYTHLVLDKINEALGLNLTKEEVLNERYIVAQKKLPLRIAGHAASYAWVGEYYFSIIEHNDLQALIAKLELDGLYPPISLIAI